VCAYLCVCVCARARVRACVRALHACVFVHVSVRVSLLCVCFVCVENLLLEIAPIFLVNKHEIQVVLDRKFVVYITICWRQIESATIPSVRLQRLLYLSPYIKFVLLGIKSYL
jgi:hypothetical protein